MTSIRAYGIGRSETLSPRASWPEARAPEDTRMTGTVWSEADSPCPSGVASEAGGETEVQAPTAFDLGEKAWEA